MLTRSSERIFNPIGYTGFAGYFDVQISYMYHNVHMIKHYLYYDAYISSQYFFKLLKEYHILFSEIVYDFRNITNMCLCGQMPHKHVAGPTPRKVQYLGSVRYMLRVPHSQKGLNSCYCVFLGIQNYIM